MTKQTFENTMVICDNFTLMSIFVRDVATIEQVEAINEWLSPLNQAILNRLKPAGTTTN